MANVGSAEFQVRVNPRRALDIIEGLEMMVGLLNDHGHEWTNEERRRLAQAVSACESRNLDVEPA